jgi:two-component system LytT family response regulator
MANKKILIEHTKGAEFISVTDILYCRANDNWTIVALKGQSFKQVCQTLKIIERRISSGYFMRVHRSYLVNLHQIEKIQGCYDELKMTEGHTVPVSRRKKKEVKQALRVIMKLV